ncbi:hypothetical protein [Sphingopyxis sp. 113P3]|uniref:hypothetical protein n=1 Tax=Sphingopyxis sp. (strain 113P3) TaxID=292913 RepID=UPI0006AD2DBC|nr:hypothetical protein [Sphingopyxis sp. 113P3]ALC10919.1 hypothetical protein LH20_03035 [Sphingopyxis sp. 113P3]
MIVSALTLLFAAQGPVPALCSAAVIAADAGGRKTNIYRTPTIAAGKVGKLGRGTPVYVCGSRGNWLWVHFSQGRHICRGTRQGLEVRHASTCAKGWVDRRRVTIIAR